MADLVPQRDTRTMAGAVSTPIQPSLVRRVVQGFTWALSGRVPDNTWFGPQTPPAPVTNEVKDARALDYPVGYNLSQKPREYEPITFGQLRALADNYDLLRLIIEARKDQLAKYEWSIQRKKKREEATRPKADARCDELEEFFKRPDKEHDWHSWLRLLLEDMFVIDAPTLYVRRNRLGGIYGFEVVDGSTIKLVLSGDGRRPVPPATAYQQVLHGVVAADFTTREMIYAPRNPRPHKVYGMSPVEQVIMTVNIAIRRQISQLNYFTEGNVPDALIAVPDTWSVDQIKQFQSYWDALLSGDLAARRKVKFVPGGMNIQYTRDPSLKDDYDEWLARVIAYCFSVPPLPFVREQNRATAESAKETALNEGLIPLMAWVKSLVDSLISDHFGYTDVEFVWQDLDDLDAKAQSAINIEYLKAGVLSIDEIRADMGKEPLGMGPAIYGGAGGVTFISELIDPEKRAAMLAQPTVGPDGKPIAPGAPGQPKTIDPFAGLPPEALHALGMTPMTKREPEDEFTNHEYP